VHHLGSGGGDGDATHASRVRGIIKGHLRPPRLSTPPFSCVLGRLGSFNTPNAPVRAHDPRQGRLGLKPRPLRWDSSRWIRRSPSITILARETPPRCKAVKRTRFGLPDSDLEPQAPRPVPAQPSPLARMLRGQWGPWGMAMGSRRRYKKRLSASLNTSRALQHSYQSVFSSNTTFFSFRPQ
jgi:hypothetical protein